MTATFDGPTACPKCGQRASYSMLACPVSPVVIGTNHLPEHARWNSGLPVVSPEPMFAVLTACYEAMRTSRAKKVAA